MTLESVRGEVEVLFDQGDVVTTEDDLATGHGHVVEGFLGLGES